MKQKILIVEDSLTIRRMLIQAIAQQTGLEIDAFDTLEGARHCQGEEYVVALVDLTLPDAPSGEAVKVLLELGLPVRAVIDEPDIAAFRARACALGQASASLLREQAAGHGKAAIAKAREVVSNPAL